MLTVHKQRLDCITTQTFQIRGFITALSFKVQSACPQLWYLVDPDSEIIQDVQVCIFGTGHEILEAQIRNKDFVGTLLMYDESLIYHAWCSRKV